MEGAAVALVAVRHALAFAELRVISNTTGRRAGQVWKLPEALARLGALARQIAR
jgi:nucleoside phosphorylase